MRITKFLVAAVAISAAVSVPNAVSGQSGSRADYIVTFSSRASSAAGAAALKAAGGQITETFAHAINGAAVSLPSNAINALRKNPHIKAIEVDAIVTASGSQDGATWGLDRIDQAALPLNSTYSWSTDGSYSSGTARVAAYIIDTGILGTHVEFTGRMGTGFSAIKDRNGTKDCNGHGTHVAGTVGGTTWGVAKGVQLIPVRVLDCRGSGTSSGVVSGIDWAIKNHAAGVPAVANLSLGGGVSSAIDTAVTNLVADGVVVAVAAGNSNADACTSSPARASAVLTVGATQSDDARASYSNYGTCLDLFAPGTSITSAWYRSNTSTNTISGTSMATPHVAGVAALVLSSDPSLTASDVMAKILGAAKADKVGNAGTGSPNKLLYSLIS